MKYFHNHPLYLYNTHGRSVQQFVPIVDGEVGFYCCGPTVYNYAHIGNLRTYIFEDTLRRTLDFLGYQTRHVMNVTDVGHLTHEEGEDKIEVSARMARKSVWEIAKYYEDAFFEDIDALNICRPHVISRATEHITDIITLIERIEKNGYTYYAEGNLYFDTDRFENYGDLVQMSAQKLRSGARVEIDTAKRNPRDFVLWFTSSKFKNQTMQWDSPWGRGYPGWHIECSAMSMRYLGEHFDIHCGGVDHPPVHHTNEIAQSEAATKTTFVNYWLHAEFLLMQNEKMSKSAQNFMTLRDLRQQGFEAEDYRWFCLQGHYRSQIRYSAQSIQGARNARLRMIERLRRLLSESSGTSAPRSEAGVWPAPPQWSKEAQPYMDRFLTVICDDLNMPEALALLWSMTKDETIAAPERLALVSQWDTIFGQRLYESVYAGDRHAASLNGAANSVEAGAEQEGAHAPLSAEQIEQCIALRNEARSNKDWKRADEIRDNLRGAGVQIEDHSNGTRWQWIVS